MIDYRKTTRSTSTSGPRRWQALAIACLGLAVTILAGDEKKSPLYKTYLQPTSLQKADSFNRAAQADPENPRAWKLPEQVENGICIDSEMPQPQNRLEVVRAQSGDSAGELDLRKDLAQAVNEFDFAVRPSPGNPALHFKYGAVLSREKRFEEALT